MSYRTGLETGDLMHVTYAVAHKVHLSMWIGKNLSECKVETDNAIAFLKQSKGLVPLVLADIVNYTIQKFQSVSHELPDFDAMDAEMIKRIETIHNVTYMARFYQYNTYVNVVFGSMEAAEKWNMLAEKVIYAGVSDFPVPDHYLFKALILVNKWKSATADERLQMKVTLDTIHQKLNKWAENCPANFAHKYFLMSTMMGYIENKSLDFIVDCFNKAMDSFGNNDFIQLKALSNELYGNFWLERGEETIGIAYIRKAGYLYRQWGAHRKVQLLEKQFPQYFTSEETAPGGTKSKKVTRGATTATTHDSINMASILKSTQAISSEIKIEKLLTILIRTMIENAGAQRGCLLLYNDSVNQFNIEVVQDKGSCRLQSHPFTDSNNLCPEIVHYVIRTGETVVIHNACSNSTWQRSPYIFNNRIKSVLCMPVVYQNQLKGIVYLENNLSDNIFTSERLEILKILSTQASISIENSRLYENMEQKVSERTLQLNNANEMLKELSLHDPLTNLHNRRYAFEFVDNKIAQFIKRKVVAFSKKEKRDMSIDENVIGIFLIDIDHFKEVNDTYGHTAGDNVLITISNVLKKMIRTDDILIRWGGEEFLIILYNTKPGYLEIFSRKVLEGVKAAPTLVSDNETLYKTCSLGFVEMPLNHNNPDLLNLEQMINLSDYALYCAKEHGRNCAAHFTLNEEVRDTTNLKNYLINLSKATNLDENYVTIKFV